MRRYFWALALLAGGVVCFGQGARSWYRAKLSRAWARAKGYIQISKVVKHTHEGDVSYTFEARYEYRVGGQTFTSDRVFFGQSVGLSARTARQLAKRYPPGRRVWVHHDPADPREAVLEAGDVEAGRYMCAVGLVLVIVALMVFLKTWYRRRGSVPASETTGRRGVTKLEGDATLRDQRYELEATAAELYQRFVEATAMDKRAERRLPLAKVALGVTGVLTVGAGALVALGHRDTDRWVLFAALAGATVGAWLLYRHYQSCEHPDHRLEALARFFERLAESDHGEKLRVTVDLADNVEEGDESGRAPGWLAVEGRKEGERFRLAVREDDPQPRGPRGALSGRGGATLSFTLPDGADLAQLREGAQRLALPEFPVRSADAAAGRLRVTWQARDGTWKLDGESLFALLDRTIQLVWGRSPYR